MTSSSMPSTTSAVSFKSFGQRSLPGFELGLGFPVLGLGFRVQGFRAWGVPDLSFYG